MPAGLVGLVLAGLFAHSMAMTSSDANAVSAVVVRDIVPRCSPGRWPRVSAAAAGGASVYTVLSGR